MTDFMRRVEMDGTCWIWTGRRNAAGYGQLEAGGRPWKAHRYVYTQVKGPIPDGLTLDHLCRRPACVNPDHLQPVSMAENLRRAEANRIIDRVESLSVAAVALRAPAATRGVDGRPNSRKVECPKGHPYDDENTLHVKEGRRCRTCRREQVREAQRRRRARLDLENASRARAVLGEVAGWAAVGGRST